MAYGDCLVFQIRTVSPRRKFCCASRAEIADAALALFFAVDEAAPALESAPHKRYAAAPRAYRFPTCALNRPACRWMAVPAVWPFPAAAELSASPQACWC